MTEQEAIIELEQIRELWWKNDDMYSDTMKVVIDQGCVNALSMAIKALEKQIAKKPHRISEIDDNDNAMVECPICHANSDYSVNTIKSGYCWKCGQKLDWQALAEMQKG